MQHSLEVGDRVMSFNLTTALKVLHNLLSVEMRRSLEV